MVVFVMSDGGLLAWDWWTGFRFYWPTVVFTMQLTHAITKASLILFDVEVHLLVVALADVNRQLAWLARQPPSGQRTHSEQR